MRRYQTPQPLAPERAPDGRSNTPCELKSTSAWDAPARNGGDRPGPTPGDPATGLTALDRRATWGLASACAEPSVATSTASTRT
jgi:hypothetical protein